jgi:hypothetical protein
MPDQSSRDFLPHVSLVDINTKNKKLYLPGIFRK